MTHQLIGFPPPSISIPVNDQKVIILDSPDGTGKSNIGYALARHLNIPYFKVNSEHQHWREGQFKTALEFDQTYLIQLLEQTKLSVVIDRAYPAEWVYSDVYNRETNLSLLSELDDRFAKLGTNIVIPVREDYSNNRKDDLVEPGMLPKLHDTYIRFRDWTKCRTITIYVDSYGENLKAELDAIVPELNFQTNPFISSDITLHRAVREKFSDEEIKAESKRVLEETMKNNGSNRRVKNVGKR